MDRTNFFNITTTDGNQEYDHLYNTLSRFTINYPVRYYRIQEEDIMRPDLISYKAYQSVSYWWLIAFINNINNPFTDMEVGNLIKIPNTIDIYDFYKKYSLR